MTEYTHNTAIKVDTYRDEFRPLLKLLNRACMNDAIMEHITEDEAELISRWLDDFKSIALEEAV